MPLFDPSNDEQRVPLGTSNTVGTSTLLRQYHADSLAYVRSHIDLAQAKTTIRDTDDYPPHGATSFADGNPHHSVHPEGEITNDPDRESPWKEGGIIGQHYRLIRPLSAGAWGMVWRAHQWTVDRPVAIKVLKSRDPEGMKNARARFKREARLASRLRHSSAVQILDFGYEDEHPYLVMEWLQGLTLAQYLQDCGPMHVALVLDIGIHIWGALDAAHHGGVIHRDLKPSNIMLVETSRGLTPVIVDFGLARTYAADESNVTRDDMVVGTPAYMCPEAIQGLPISHVSDVYSMGVTLITAIIGENPFRGQTGAISMTNHLLERPLDDHILEAFGCSPALAQTLMRTIAVDPNARPNAQELEETFRALLDAYLDMDVEDWTQSHQEKPDTPGDRSPETSPTSSSIPPAHALPMSPPQKEKNIRSLWVIVFGLLFFLLCGVTAVYYVYDATRASSDITARTIAPVPLSATQTDEAPVREPSFQAIVISTVKQANRHAVRTVAAAKRTLQDLSSSDNPSVAPSSHATTKRAQRPRSGATKAVHNAAPATGELILTISPPGQVQINGQHHGTRSSLLLRELPSGTYRVTITRDGNTINSTITLQEGERRVATF